MKRIEKNKLIISILFGIMFMFLTAGIVVQIKTVSNDTTAVGKTQAENQLRDSVLRWKEKYESTNLKYEREEKNLESLRELAASSTDSASNASVTLEDYNKILGNSELVGTGITITLKDGDKTTATGFPSNYIVHDADLYEIVNALKQAGAEAISVNGHRIVSGTGISCVGNVITINGEKVGNPFTIKAIGPTSQLYGAMTMAGGYLELLENDGLQVKIEQDDKGKTIVEKFGGTYKFKYAHTINE